MNTSNLKDKSHGEKSVKKVLLSLDEEEAPQVVPPSPKKGMAEKMLKREHKANTDFNLEVDNQNNLLKSPKRGLSMRINRNDEKAIGEKNENIDCFLLNNQNIKTKPNKQEDNGNNASEDNNTKTHEDVCPSSPKKYMTTKLLKKDHSLKEENPLELENFNSLENDSNEEEKSEIYYGKTETLIISPPDSPKKYTNTSFHPQKNTFDLNNCKADKGDNKSDDESDEMSLDLGKNELVQTHKIPIKVPVKHQEAIEQGANTLSNREDPQLQCPSSPKKDIQKKIKLNSETLINEVKQINGSLDGSSDYENEELEVPKSPKKNQVIRMKAKVNSELKNMLFLDKLPSKPTEEEKRFSVSEELKLGDDMDTRDYSDKFNSNKNLLDKVKILESKITSLENELRFSKDLISKKNKEIDNNISQHNLASENNKKEKQALEARISKFENHNNFLINEVQYNRSKIKDLEKKHLTMKQEYDSKLNSLTQKIEHVFSIMFNGDNSLNITKNQSDIFEES